MKKIVFLVIGILLVIGLVGVGTLAYFSDTEETTENVIQAGTIDLALIVDEEVSGIFSFTAILPGDVLEPMVIKLANVGQNNGYLYQKITYAEGDLGTPVENLTADEFAALIYVESMFYQHFDLDGYVGTPRDDMGSLLYIDGLVGVGNSDGYCSLYEMGKVGWMPYSIDDPEDALDAGHAATYTIVFHMAEAFAVKDNPGTAYTGLMSAYEGIYKLYMGDPVVWNAPQADGIKITWTAILNQNPGMPD